MKNPSMLRVLVVEDSRPQAHQLRLILESDGFEVEIAEDGQAGLDRLAESRFDLVLSDVIMPRLGGFDLCKRIRADRKLRTTPVILLTAFKDVVDIIEGLECGADNYVTKPYAAKHLLDRIHGVLQRRSQPATRRADGAIQLVAGGRSFAIGLDKQRILDILVSTFEDFTAARQREQESMLAVEKERSEAAALRESERFFQSTLDALAVYMAVLDESGKIIATNEAWADSEAIHSLFGQRCSVGANYLKICGSNHGQAGEAATRISGAIRELLSGRLTPVHLEYAYGTVEKNWFQVRVTRFKGPGPIRLIVTHEDITERKRTEEALRNSETQLQQSQKIEAIGTLAGGIAHDFNNLLTVISGNCHLARTHPEDTDSVSKDIEMIEEAADHAASLTRQLLAFSRKQVLQPRVLDPNSSVRKLEPMLRRLVSENIELVIIPDPALARVKVDEGQLEQVLINLVVNARDAMPRGGKLIIQTSNVALDAPAARLLWRAQPGDYVVLSVNDTGCGMDASVRERIFEPFFTTKEQGKGTGLGLSTVYGIVKQSGGYITVDSEPGRGTTFKVYFQRTDEAVDRATSRAPASESLRGSETVLVVEDEKAVKELVCTILRAYGYTVVTAAHGQEALEFCTQYAGSIDLLLTDIVMPGISGLELGQRLRDERPGIHVLHMSGYTDDTLSDHGALDASIDLIRKPFKAEALAEKLREVLTTA